MTGEELRVYRKTNRLTQTDLGRLLDMSAANICRYEKGVAPIPHVVVLALHYLKPDLRMGRKFLRMYRMKPARN